MADERKVLSPPRLNEVLEERRFWMFFIKVFAEVSQKISGPMRLTTVDHATTTESRHRISIS